MPQMFAKLSRYVASNPHKPYVQPVFRARYGRAFRSKHARRLLILFRPDRICYTSVFPFIYYADEFAARYDVEVRLCPIDDALDHGIPKGLANPTHILAQTWLTEPQEKHDALAKLFDTFPDTAVKAYLDSFANSDIRLAGTFSNADFYFKKSLLVDTNDFIRPTYGHTNLTEYYGRLYDLDDEMTDWKVPQSVFPKLRLAPNFLTSPALLYAFLDADAPPPFEAKNIDVHARLGGTKNDGWYGEMRRHSEREIGELSDLNIMMGTGISQDQFWDEMGRSKTCFSPFGFGELCWRDIEAMAYGAVLIKPDMSHLRTEPDLYRNGETYVACRWDFADLEEKTREILNDDEKRRHIANTAWSIARDYLAKAGPVSTYGALFEEPS